MFVFNTVVIATHRRSGARLLLDALRQSSPDINDAFMSLEQIETNRDATMPLAAFRRQLLGLEGQVLINLHDLPAADNWTGLDERLFVRTILRNSPTIYVHRDGRDVLVSLYFYMKSMSETVRNQSFSRFLRGEVALAGAATSLSRPAYWAQHVDAWLAKDNVLPIAYNDLERDQIATLQRVAAFLNINLHAGLVSQAASSQSDQPGALKKALSRVRLWQPGSASSGHPRQGKSGDWRRVFSKQDRAFFMREAGHTLRRLGYDK